MANWIAKVQTAFRAVAHGMGLGKKVKSTPFDQTSGKMPLNASGVVQVDADRFVFVDNHDPAALLELALDADGVEAERISHRPLAGLAEGQLRDPEGLTRVIRDGELSLVVASSLCVLGANESRQQQVCDGLVRVRYQPHGDLQAEPMPGFRDWLLSHFPSIAAASRHEPDAGGLNIEGLAWEPNSQMLLFGLRGPAEPGTVTVIRVPIDAGGARWDIESLGTPSMVRLELPRPKAKQGIRDISYDEETGELLILVGRSTSTADEPFQLCSWNGVSDTLRLFDVKFHRLMKPEGVVAFTTGDERRLLIVDDRGGYAVVGYPEFDQ